VSGKKEKPWAVNRIGWTSKLQTTGSLVRRLSGLENVARRKEEEHQETHSALGNKVGRVKGAHRKKELGQSEYTKGEKSPKTTVICGRSTLEREGATPPIKESILVGGGSWTAS